MEEGKRGRGEEDIYIYIYRARLEQWPKIARKKLQDDGFTTETLGDRGDTLAHCSRIKMIFENEYGKKWKLSIISRPFTFLTDGYFFSILDSVIIYIYIYISQVCAIT